MQRKNVLRCQDIPTIHTVCNTKKVLSVSKNLEQWDTPLFGGNVHVKNHFRKVVISYKIKHILPYTGTSGHLDILLNLHK